MRIMMGLLRPKNAKLSTPVSQSKAEPGDVGVPSKQSVLNRRDLKFATLNLSFEISGVKYGSVLRSVADAGARLASRIVGGSGRIELPAHTSASRRCSVGGFLRGVRSSLTVRTEPLQFLYNRFQRSQTRGERVKW